MKELRVPPTAPETLDVFRASFPNQEIVVDVAQTNPHAVAAAARTAFRNVIKTDMESYTIHGVVHAGPSVVRVIHEKGDVHCCAPMLTDKDVARGEDTLTKLKPSGDAEHDSRVADFGDYMQGKDTEFICRKLVQDCNVPATVLVAEDVVYDVTPEQFVKAMINHGSTVGYITYHTPTDIFLGADFHKSKHINMVCQRASTIGQQAGIMKYPTGGSVKTRSLWTRIKESLGITVDPRDTYFQTGASGFFDVKTKQMSPTDVELLDDDLIFAVDGASYRHQATTIAKWMGVPETFRYVDAKGFVHVVRTELLKEFCDLKCVKLIVTRAEEKCCNPRKQEDALTGRITMTHCKIAYQWTSPSDKWRKVTRVVTVPQETWNALTSHVVKTELGSDLSAQKVFGYASSLSNRVLISGKIVRSEVRLDAEETAIMSSAAIEYGKMVRACQDVPLRQNTLFTERIAKPTQAALGSAFRDGHYVCTVYPEGTVVLLPEVRGWNLFGGGVPVAPPVGFAVPKPGLAKKSVPIVFMDMKPPVGSLLVTVCAGFGDTLDMEIPDVNTILDYVQAYNPVAVAMSVETAKLFVGQQGRTLLRVYCPGYGSADEPLVSPIGYGPKAVPTAPPPPAGMPGGPMFVAKIGDECGICGNTITPGHVCTAPFIPPPMQFDTVAPTAPAPPAQDCLVCSEPTHGYLAACNCPSLYCAECYPIAMVKASTMCLFCGVAQLKPPRPFVGATRKRSKLSVHLAGHLTVNTVRMKFTVPGGLQTAAHPNEGQPYGGKVVTAYLPDDKQGNDIADLFEFAFDAGHLFTVGTSTTTGLSDMVTYNDIHMKTTLDIGATHGYPDATYLDRVTEELAGQGYKVGVVPVYKPAVGSPAKLAPGATPTTASTNTAKGTAVAKVLTNELGVTGKINLFVDGQATKSVGEAYALKMGMPTWAVAQTVIAPEQAKINAMLHVLTHRYKVDPAYANAIKGNWVTEDIDDTFWGTKGYDALGKCHRIVACLAPATHVKRHIGDITQMTNVLVDAANSTISPGGGVTGALYAAFPTIMANHCVNQAALGPIPTGSSSRFGTIIHTVGPSDGNMQALAQAYKSVVPLVKAGETISIPLISTGLYQSGDALSAVVVAAQEISLYPFPTTITTTMALPIANAAGFGGMKETSFRVGCLRYTRADEYAEKEMPDILRRVVKNLGGIGITDLSEYNRGTNPTVPYVVDFDGEQWPDEEYAQTVEWLSREAASVDGMERMMESIANVYRQTPVNKVTVKWQFTNEDGEVMNVNQLPEGTRFVYLLDASRIVDTMKEKLDPTAKVIYNVRLAPFHSKQLMDSVATLDLAQYHRSNRCGIKGPPGTGKTFLLTGVYNRGDFMMCHGAKTRAELSEGRAKDKVKTYTSLLINGTHVKDVHRILCDEAWMVHAGMLNVVELVLRPQYSVYVGDEHQIGDINFYGPPLVKAKLTITNMMTLDITKRCTPQITQILRNTGYYKTTTGNLRTCNTTGSIAVLKQATDEHSVAAQIPTPAEGHRAAVLTVRRRSERALKAAVNKRTHVMTVHAAQGMTYDTIYIENVHQTYSPLLNTTPMSGHALVALSRHKGNLVYFGNAGHVDKGINKLLRDTKLEPNLMATDSDFGDMHDRAKQFIDHHAPPMNQFTKLPEGAAPVLFSGSEAPFSNFYPCKVCVDGREFNCSEQAYMYAKAKFAQDDAAAERIYSLVAPGAIKRAGTDIKNYNHEAWRKVCLSKMAGVLRAKFDQNPELKWALRATGRVPLGEATTNRYWAIGTTESGAGSMNSRGWTGTNHMGKLLMDLRAKYDREAVTKQEKSTPIVEEEVIPAPMPEPVMHQEPEHPSVPPPETDEDEPVTLWNHGSCDTCGLHPCECGPVGKPGDNECWKDTVHATAKSLGVEPPRKEACEKVYGLVLKKHQQHNAQNALHDLQIKRFGATGYCKPIVEADDGPVMIYAGDGNTGHWSNVPGVPGQQYHYKWDTTNYALVDKLVNCVRPIAGPKCMHLSDVKGKYAELKTLYAGPFEDLCPAPGGFSKVAGGEYSPVTHNCGGLMQYSGTVEPVRKCTGSLPSCGCHLKPTKAIKLIDIARDGTDTAKDQYEHNKGLFEPIVTGCLDVGVKAIVKTFYCCALVEFIRDKEAYIIRLKSSSPAGQEVYVTVGVPVVDSPLSPAEAYIRSTGEMLSHVDSLPGTLVDLDAKQATEVLATYGVEAETIMYQLPESIAKVALEGAATTTVANVMAGVKAPPRPLVVEKREVLVEKSTPVEKPREEPKEIRGPTLNLKRAKIRCAYRASRTQHRVSQAVDIYGNDVRVYHRRVPEIVENVGVESVLYLKADSGLPVSINIDYARTQYASLSAYWGLAAGQGYGSEYRAIFTCTPRRFAPASAYHTLCRLVGIQSLPRDGDCTYDPVAECTCGCTHNVYNTYHGRGQRNYCGRIHRSVEKWLGDRGAYEKQDGGYVFYNAAIYSPSRHTTHTSDLWSIQEKIVPVYGGHTTPDKTTLVKNILEANAIHVQDVPSDEIHYRSYPAVPPVEQSSHLDYGAEAASVVQAYIDEVLPGLSQVDTAYDYIHRATQNVEVELDNVKLDATRLAYNPKEKIAMTPVVRTGRQPKLDLDYPSLLEAYSKRNANVVPLECDEGADVRANAMVSALVKYGFVEDAADILEEYRQNPVGLRPTNVQLWSTKLEGAKVDQLNKSYDKTSRPVGEDPVGVFSLTLKAKLKNIVSTANISSTQKAQTIHSHEPTVTAAYSPVFQVLQKRLERLMRPQFVLPWGRDSTNVEAHATFIMRDLVDKGLYKEGTKFIETDASSFDKSQGHACHLVKMLIYEMLGMDEEMLTWWEDGHLRHVSVCKPLGMKFGVDTQHKSGDASTLFGNTIINLAAFCYAYQLTPDIGLFVGDDGALLADVQDPVEVDRRYAEIANLETKTFERVHAYFCGAFLIWDANTEILRVVRDPVKAAVGLGDMSVRTVEELEDRRISLQGSTAAWRDHSIRATLSDAVSERYGLSWSVDALLDSMLTLASSRRRYSALYV